MGCKTDTALETGTIGRGGVGEGHEQLLHRYQGAAAPAERPLVAALVCLALATPCGAAVPFVMTEDVHSEAEQVSKLVSGALRSPPTLGHSLGTPDKRRFPILL